VTATTTEFGDVGGGQVVNQASQTITVTVPAPATATNKSSFTVVASASSGWRSRSPARSVY